MHITESPFFFWSNAFLSSHFAPAFFFLDAERRRALKVIYAVFRLLDDAVDKNTENPRPLVTAWKNLFETGSVEYVRPFGNEDLAREFIMVMKKFDIPSFIFLDFIKHGLEKDMMPQRFGTPMDTEGYCYGVAGTVGLACLPVFGVPLENGKEFAIRLGITVQWINTIRDVGVDAKMGRIYLPLDHLEKFGCEEAEILSCRPTPQFAELMKYEGQVARGHFQRASELMPSKWKRQLLPARIMGEIYMKLLAKIEKQEYPVLTKRITLNLFEKGIATWKTVRN